MKIGLDWDGTFTADPKSWQKFIDIMTLAGHEVYITTSRGEDTPIEMTPNNLAGVIYCNFVAKKEVIPEIDVWIDDNPYYINNSFAVVPTGPWEPPKLLMELIKEQE